jgi:hypothetical protein
MKKSAKSNQKFKSEWGGDPMSPSDDEKFDYFSEKKQPD